MEEKSKPKGRIAKIAGLIIIIPLIIVSAAIVSLYLPPVQKYIIEKCSKYIAESSGYDLTIGKFRLSPAMIQYKRWSGLYSKDDKHLYINDGIGYGLYPMRIGARPEITIFELKSTKQHN